MPSIIGLVTNTTFTEIENKRPDTAGVITKANFSTNITETENKVANVMHLTKRTYLSQK